MRMWHIELEARIDEVRRRLRGTPSSLPGDVHPSATLDCSAGPISIGAGTKVCENAVLRGPLVLGEGCIVGTNTVIRGPASIGDKVLIGNGAEIKHAIVEDEASLGPYSYVADSIVRRAAFLGALVRTSNYRLDHATVTVMDADGNRIDTGRKKLGCEIGRGTHLGVGVVVLPGRIVPAGSLFGPGVVIGRNHHPGRWSARQDLDFARVPEPHSPQD